MVEELKIVKIGKIHTISRFFKILNSLSLKEQNKAFVKICYYFSIFLCYLHLSACIWYYIIRWHDQWIPPFNLDGYKYTSIYEESMLYQYLSSFYYMIACFGGNEMGPLNPLECIYIILMMVFAAIINANLFGEMSFLMTVVSKTQMEFQLKVDVANTTMHNINLENKVQEEIRQYFRFTQATLY